VTKIDWACADVIWLTMQSPDGQPLQKALPRPVCGVAFCTGISAFSKLFAFGSSLDQALSDQRENRAGRARGNPAAGSCYKLTVSTSQATGVVSTECQKGNRASVGRLGMVVESRTANDAGKGPSLHRRYSASWVTLTPSNAQMVRRPCGNAASIRDLQIKLYRKAKNEIMAAQGAFAGRQRG
jgi:hypothetical protein